MGPNIVPTTPEDALAPNIPRPSAGTLLNEQLDLFKRSKKLLHFQMLTTVQSPYNLASVL